VKSEKDGVQKVNERVIAIVFRCSGQSERQNVSKTKERR
jgi:hypothetical protein